MDINKFKDEVHANAIAHGWWGKGYTDAVVIALIHSEISEVLQAYRNREPMVRYECTWGTYGSEITWCKGKKCQCSAAPNDEKNCKFRTNPHGVAVELIDVVLRILDAAAAWDVKLLDDYWGSYDPDQFANQLRATADEIVECYTLPELVCELHRMTVELRRLREVGAASELHAADMSFMIGMVYTWLRAQNIDPEALMLEKHRYNVTRPYKHGNKRI